jgi:hypothetical protein
MCRSTSADAALTAEPESMAGVIKRAENIDASVARTPAPPFGTITDEAGALAVLVLACPLISLGEGYGMALFEIYRKSDNTESDNECDG